MSKIRTARSDRYNWGESDVEFIEVTENAFCPTGIGGGVDPSCSPGGGKNSHLAAGVTVVKLEKAIDESPGLSPAKKQQYKDTVLELAAKMPARAHELLNEGLHGAKFFNSSRDIQDGYFEDMWQKQSGFAKILGGGKATKKHEFLSKTEGLEGLYDLDSQHVYLDGGAQSGDAKGIYAHELAHAIDKGHRFSDHPSWQKAFKADVDQPDNPLTKYARTNHSEGFAEFARVLYASQYSPKEIESAFPVASKAFKEFGLWPS